MGDEPSCFQTFVYTISRLKRGVLRLFRRLFHVRSQRTIQPNENVAASVNPEPVQVLLPYVDPPEVRDRDPLRLQIFVPIPPDPLIPPPPPPPLPFEPPRRRRHSRPAPTYDLATLIEIKDALETLEMREQLASDNNFERIHEHRAILEHAGQSASSVNSKGSKRISS